MNNLKKIGVSALAGSLVAFSVNAGEMAVSGSASLTYSDTSEASASAFTMNNSINFDGSGELDNGMSVAVNIEFDGDEGDGGEGLDNHSITLDTNGAGVIKFVGHGGASVVSSMDDKTPTAYEEVWDVTSGVDSEIDGSDNNDAFGYTSPSFGGVTIMASYDAGDNGKASYDDAVNSTDAYFDYGFMYTGIEGLEIGAAKGEVDKSTDGATQVDETVAYVKYAAGPVTVGLQRGEADSTAAGADLKSTAIGIAFAVNDDFSVSFGKHDLEYDDGKPDQESSGFSFSYTMGSMSFGGAINSTDNVAGSSTTDNDGLELNVGFAF